MNGRKLVICLVVLVLVLLLVLAVLAIMEINRRNTNIPDAGNGPTTTGNTPTSTVSNDPGPAYSVRVSTVYGNLYYQDQWEEFMRIEQTQEGDALTVLFLAEIKGRRIPLFSVSVGGEQGSKVGTLTDASGAVRDVYILQYSLEELSDLTESERNRLCAMQEDINYVIENLR